MTIDYPAYYKTFRCIGSRCPDSCCIGWEVDIDESTWQYYQSVRGSFGDRLRTHMAKEAGDDSESMYFPLEKDGRCPFLNEKNLCEIILHLGEESLSQVCTEYPRYFLEDEEFGFEQIDLSLSCMEAGRIFFEDPEPVEYIREEIRMPERARDTSCACKDPRSDGQTGRNDTFPKQEQSAKDSSLQNALQSVLDIRDDCIAILQDRNTPLLKRFREILRLYGPEEWQGNISFSSSAWSLLKRMRMLESLDDRWTRELAKVEECLAAASAQSSEVLASAARHSVCRLSSSDSSAAAPSQKSRQSMTFFLSSCRPLLCDATEGRFPVWFEKLGCYFLFRYITDAFFAERSLSSSPIPYTGVAASVRFSTRSLAFLYLMCVTRFREHGGRFDIQDMIDLAHLYSREVEHSDENVALLKEP